MNNTGTTIRFWITMLHRGPARWRPTPHKVIAVAVSIPHPAVAQPAPDQHGY